MPYLHYFSDQVCSKCKHVADFSLLHAAPIAAEIARKTGRGKYQPSGDRFRGLFICMHCREPAMLEFSRRPNTNFARQGQALPQPFEMYLNRLAPLDAQSKGSSPSTRRVMAIQNPENFGIDLSPYCIVNDAYPKEETEAPSDLPEEIRTLYEELEEVRNSARYTCVACRAIVEAVCKSKLESMPRNLAEGIDALVANGHLPQTMADWAHEVRLGGNSAVHDSSRVDESEAGDLREFTRMLLELLYSYPAKIVNRRGGT